MIKVYFKQALELLRQNRLFSALYVAGTGLAIAMIMVVAVIYYVKIAPVYPEYNRGRTMYFSSIKCTQEGRMSSSSLSYQAVQELVAPLKHYELYSLSESVATNDNYIQPDDRSGDFAVYPRCVDTNFFRLYNFEFIDGKPFTDADQESGLRAAVITSDVARRLYGTAEGVVGRTFKMDYVEYRVCGVVRPASVLTRSSFGHVYTPVTSSGGYKDTFGSCDMVGSLSVTFLVRDAAQGDSLYAALQERVRQRNLQHEGDWQVDIFQQPRTHLISALGFSPMKEVNVWAVVARFLLLFAVLLFVPALNLSAMISGRMESRLAEMGVRKTFGAGRGVLLRQVMWENLLLTLLGGLLGLLLAWLMLYVGREWIFGLFDEIHFRMAGAPTTVSGEMFFAPAVFACALVVCFLLNMCAALVPAWHSLRQPIVRSLYEKR